MALSYSQRFYSKIKPYLTDDECHIWDGAKNIYGYGNFQGKLAHRIAWKLAISEIPAEQLVCHKCDNPSCVNPRHLFIGSHLDNARDKMRKGRHQADNNKIYPSMVRDEILLNQLKDQIKNRREQRKLKA